LNYTTNDIIERFYVKTSPENMLIGYTPTDIIEDFYDNSNDIFEKMYVLQCEYD
jgi:hypothetical protein